MNNWTNNKSLTGKKDIFLSYRSTKLEIAKRIFEELEHHKISVWFDKDVLHENVGEKYLPIIQKGINNAQIFLLIYSKDIEDSNFIIENELNYAIKHKKKILIFPLEAVENINNERLKQLFNQIQFINNENNVNEIYKLKEAMEDENSRRKLGSLWHDPSLKAEEYLDINLFILRISIQKIIGMPTPYGRYTTLARAEKVYDTADIGIKVINKALFIPIPEKFYSQLKELKFFTTEKEEEQKISNLLCWLNPNDTELYNKLIQFIITKYPEYDSLEKANCLIQEVANETASEFITDININKKTYFNGAMLGVYDMSDYRTPDEERHSVEIKMYYSNYFTFKCTVKLYHKLASINNCFLDIKLCNINEFAPFLCSLGMGGFLVAEQDSNHSLLWIKRANNISAGNIWHFSFDETINVFKDSNKDSNNEIKINADKSIDINAYANYYRALREENGVIKERLCQQRGGIIEIGIIQSDRLEIELLSYAVVEFAQTPALSLQMRAMVNSSSDGYLEISKFEFRPTWESVHNYIGRLFTPESHHLSEIILSDLGKELLKKRNHKYGNNVTIWDNVRIEESVEIGDGTVVESYCHLLKGCKIGKNCKIHEYIHIDEGVSIGNNVKIQNHNCVYHGVTLGDGVFIGPNVTFTNDKRPRSITSEGILKTTLDWECSKTNVEYGASIGGGSTIVCGITIGKWAMVGAGSVVTKDVPPYALVVGNPARIVDWVSESGFSMERKRVEENYLIMYCNKENKEYKIPLNNLEKQNTILD